MDALAGRECGDCTACCTLLGIDAPDFSKLPGVACGHCAKVCCAIYATRPVSSREFFCGWRLIDRGEPVHLCAPGEAGRHLGRVRLNENPVLRQAIARGDFAATTALLSQAVQLCIALPKGALKFRNAGAATP